MADSNPLAKSFPFTATWNGVQVTGTAVARRDKIELYPVPGLCIEFEPDEFMHMSKRVIVAAHIRSR